MPGPEVEAWTRIGAAGGRILELGAGSGRVTIPLARAGFDVVAVDASPAMLAKLRARVDALCAKRPLYEGFRGYTTYVA